MRTLSYRWLVLPLALCVLSISVKAHDLFTLKRITSDQSAVITGLNNEGVVTGSREDPTVSSRRAFAWWQGRFIDLSRRIGASTDTEALGLNDHADIVGSYAASQASVNGFLLVGDRVTPIAGLPNDDHVAAVSINNRAQVVGRSQMGDTFPIRSFIWHRGRVTQLDALPGGLGYAAAEKINDHGVVVGTAISPVDFGYQAVIWKDGTIMALGRLPFSGGSIGLDINNREQAVGYALLSQRAAAFIWQDGEMSALPLLSANQISSHASSINDAGIVAGSTDGDAGSVATLWVNGAPIDLNTLIASRDPLKRYVTLVQAQFINNRNQIVAIGVDSRTPAADRSVYFLEAGR